MSCHGEILLLTETKPVNHLLQLVIHCNTLI